MDVFNKIFGSIKEINKLLKEINRLLDKEMSNICFKGTVIRIEKALKNNYICILKVS